MPKPNFYTLANASLWSKIEQFGTENMKKELELLKKRNEALALECVEAYKPVKQLSPEFQDYEPPGVHIEGKIYYFSSGTMFTTIFRHKTKTRSSKSLQRYCTSSICPCYRYSRQSVPRFHGKTQS